MTDATSSDEMIEDREPGVGVRLREAREDKQLELRDVARQTRQSQDTLAALESGDTDHIPSSILRLQARNYARFLGLPEEEIASAYADVRRGINTEAMPNEVARGAYPSQKIMVGAGLAAMVLAVVAGSAALLLRGPAPDAADQLAISARLAPTFDRQDALAGLGAEIRDEFSIRAIKPAWIEVRGSDGTVFRNRQMQAGEIYYPRAGAGWTITVRDAGAFEWRLGDTPAGRIGDEQQALYSVSVDNAHEMAQSAQNAALAEASDQRKQP